MRFHCMTNHGFVAADVIRRGDMVRVTVHCVGAPPSTFNDRYELSFRAPNLQRHEGFSADKLFALFALSYFHRTRLPLLTIPKRLSPEQLQLDESLTLCEAV